MRSSWQRYLLVGALAAVGVAALPLGVLRDVAYVLVGVSGVTAMVVGTRRNRPALRRAWYLIAVGNASWILGDVLFSWYQDVALTTTSPSLADVPYLAAYPILAGGLLMIVRSRGPGGWSTALLDSTVLTLGLGLVSWVFLVLPTWAAADASLLERIIGVAYPLGDGLLLAVLLRLATGPGAWNTSARLLVGSFSLLLVADSLFQAATFVPAIAAYVSWLDPGWLLAYVLVGAAALHPSMRGLSEAGPDRDDMMPTRRLVALATAVMVGPVILVGELALRATLHLLSITAAAAVILPLVLTRMIRMVRQLQDQARRLSLLADTDYVTGLANRRRFADRLDEILCPGQPQDAFVMLIDLERFSEISETLGDRAGEAILQSFAARLSALAGPDALVARIGGEAFGVLDTSIARSRDAEAAAVRIRDALALPYQLPNLSLSVEVNIGLVVVPEDADEPALALNRASVALSAAKGRPGRVARYGAEMETGGTLAPLLAGELRAALENEEIILHYQPQVEIFTGRVTGVEALARWQHPRHGLLGPDSFIAAAEQTGLIGPLTRYVLDHALRECAGWRRAGLDLTVAVNLSVRNLLDPGLVDEVRQALERHELRPESLELEITESSAMVDPYRSKQVLSTLAELGVTLSIDDYGTGHSSLAYLQRLPVGRLKIDRSFVAGLLTDDASEAIVRSTIDLAMHLRLDVIAEGVEDDRTLLMLRDMRCFAVQGFGLGRPVEASAIPALVDRIESRLPEVLGTAETDAVTTRSAERWAHDPSDLPRQHSALSTDTDPVQVSRW